jgi:hypothetical protein
MAISYFFGWKVSKGSATVECWCRSDRDAEVPGATGRDLERQPAAGLAAGSAANLRLRLSPSNRPDSAHG